MRQVSFFAIVVLIFSSCTKSGSTTNPPYFDPNATIYISGYSFDSIKELKTAKYWKDLTEVFLSDGTKDDIANCIFVSGSHVYAGGSVGFYPSTAVYWDNGTRKNLNPGEITSVSSIFVSGTDIHMAGRGPNTKGETIPDAPFFAKYLENGITVPLGDEEHYTSWGNAVTVSGNDVYVAWSQLGSPVNEIAKYTKNGTPVNLSDSLSSDAVSSSIFISGTDVYVSGSILDSVSHNFTAAYWKNGILTKLKSSSNSSAALGIAVSGQDIYVCGNVNDVHTLRSIATYWKNGEVFPLTDGTSNSSTCGIAIAGTDVYIAGMDNNFRIPVFWKNGQPHTLNYDPAFYQTVTGIFVVKK